MRVEVEVEVAVTDLVMVETIEVGRGLGITFETVALCHVMKDPLAPSELQIYAGFSSHLPHQYGQP